MKVAAIILLATMAACATPTQPYVSELPAGFYDHAFDYSRDGSVAEEVVVHNPLHTAVEVEVFCPGDVYRGHSYATICVDAGAERRLIVDVNKRDFLASRCVVASTQLVGSCPK